MSGTRGRELGSRGTRAPTGVGALGQGGGRGATTLPRGRLMVIKILKENEHA